MESLSAEIIAVGTELLLGDILNTNAQFLSQRLSELGFNVFYQTVVGDNPERLVNAVNTASKRADVIVTSGGLGPTEDDLTKETVAAALGLELVKSEEAYSDLLGYFNGAFPKSNLKQAYVPEGAVVLRNDNGTAPGVIISKGGKTFVMLPGPPGELVPMFRDKAEPILKRLTGATIMSEVVRIFGIGEAAVGEMLSDLTKRANPTVAPYAKTGEVTLRITAKTEDAESAKALIKEARAEIEKRLGEYIYGFGEDGLDKVTTRTLAEKGLTAATAESCTAGLLAAALTELAGASETFGEGVITYSNEAKRRYLGVSAETLEKHGAVSGETACEMAEGIRRKSGADIGASVTGIAGPGGGTEEKPVGLIYIGISSRHGTFSKKLLFKKGSREKNRTKAVLAALDLIRREALK